MSTTIKEFYFSPITSSQVLIFMLKSRNFSNVGASNATGIQYDTLRKCLAGEVQRVSIDTIFKVCKVTGYTLMDYFRMYFEIEGSHLYDDVISPTQTENSSAVPETSSAFTCPGAETIKAHIDLMQTTHSGKVTQQYEIIIAELHEQVAQLKEGRAMMHAHYQRTTDHLYDEIKRLEAENLKLEAENDELYAKRHRHQAEK